jgi:hypothetical protein
LQSDVCLDCEYSDIPKKNVLYQVSFWNNYDIGHSPR